MGDAILMTPAIDFLVEKYPDVKITLLLPKSYANLFQCHPGVSEIWEIEAHSIVVWAMKISAAWFDLVLDLNSSGTSQWLRRIVLAKRKISDPHTEATAKRHKPRPNGLEWDMFCLRDSLGLSIPDTSQLLPKIYLWEEELSQAREFWKSRGIARGNIVVFGSAATRATKRWPAMHYAQLAEMIRTRLGISVAFFVGTSREDKLFVREILENMSINPDDNGPAGKVIVDRVTNLRNYAALLATSYGYVGNDSGPKHLSVAVGTPTLTFFGPEDPLEWHPYSLGDHPILYMPGLPCRKEDNGRWCALTECIAEKHRCMRDLSPESAFNTFLGLQRVPGVHDLHIAKKTEPTRMIRA